MNTFVLSFLETQVDYLFLTVTYIMYDIIFYVIGNIIKRT